MDEKLREVCKLLRYDILTATTAAGNGHPTSSLSAVELMATLFFGGFFHTNLNDPHDPTNDKLIFSKGHAAPLLYAMYHVAGVLKYEELLKLRTFESNLEGHPTPNFPYVDVATGSLGQGLSIGVGMALGINLKIENLKLKIAQTPKVFVLVGDSELAEGQNWEAMELASYYKLGNLVAILDMNRLGQRGETMAGWNADVYAKRAEAFGWESIIIKDGHDIEEIYKTFNHVGTGPYIATLDGAQRDLSLHSQTISHQGINGAQREHSVQKPVFIIAHTIKGKGVSFLENQDGWHGKAVPKDMLEKALKEIGDVDRNLRMSVQKNQLTSETLKKSDKSVLSHAEARSKILDEASSECEKNDASARCFPPENGVSMTNDDKKTEVLDKLKSYFSP